MILFRRIIIALSMVLLLALPVFSAPTSGIQGQEPARPQTEASKDVLIIYEVARRAFFGWYKAAEMPSTGWNLLNRTIIWSSNFKLPNETKMVFFTYDGTVQDPPRLGDVNREDADVVYCYLKNVWGYAPTNITVRPISDAATLPSAYYGDFDLVVYWNTYGYDSSDIVVSNVPFITVSTMQTDEMQLGTGTTTLHDYRKLFHIVNIHSYPTQKYPFGPLPFESLMWFDATEAASHGKVLVKAEVQSVTTGVSMDMMQDNMVGPDGSAGMYFTLNIPAGPLADTYREAFFSSPSSIPPGVEVPVPENKTVRDSVQVEETVNDVSLLGDINGDGKLDIKDIATIAIAFGSSHGTSKWNSEADLNWDGKIDIKDIASAAKGFGKTRFNTGRLNVISYYNGTAVNCTSVYYVGPERSSPVNMSASGLTWFGLWPGSYTVYGTYNMTERNTTVTVVAEKTTYAQLDFGGAPPPPPQTETVPVKEPFHLGMMVDQATLLGFDTIIVDSRIMPWGTTNETRISLMAYSAQFAKSYAPSTWRITVGPWTIDAVNITGDFMFTKIHYLQLMLRSLLGNQTYLLHWTMGTQLPPGATLLNPEELIGKSWTIDFGGGTYMHTDVIVVATGVIVEEVIQVTEQNITATQEYLAEAFSQYKVFKIDYFLPGSAILETSSTAEVFVKAAGDWSSKWTYTISPGSFKKSWEKTWTYGKLSATFEVTPALTVEWYVGWDFEWFSLKRFETWMKITPSVTAKAYAGATASYTKTWSHEFSVWERKFTFWVGPVFVWADLELTATPIIEVNAYGEVSVTVTAKAYAYFKAGVKWTKSDGWKGILETGYGADLTGPTITAKAGLSVTPKVQVRLAFMFYSVAGPYVEGVPYAPISITLLPSRTWSVKLRFQINAGVTMAGWLKSILGLNDWSKTLKDWELKSWSGSW